MKRCDATIMTAEEFVEINRRSPVTKAHVIFDSSAPIQEDGPARLGAHYVLKNHRNIVLSSEEHRLLPLGYPRWDL